ncbi:MAG: hypothetical protein OQK82_06920 [Candidatus Pacearchaeota archaeon]|nr:hypothetical protein [Candidatus Pacearchaeota archaeon]
MKVLARTNEGYMVYLSYTEIAHLGGDCNSNCDGFENNKGSIYKYTDLPLGSTICVSNMYTKSREITNSLKDMSTKMKSVSTSIQNLLSGMENRLHSIEVND